VSAPDDNLVGTWVEQKLIAVERQMQATLDATRAATGHPTTVGDTAEAEVRRVLRDHLPTGLRVGHGHVHDSFGNVSKQTDVVVTNPDHPFNFPDDTKAGEFFLEGVSAVGEVKANLGTRDLDSCISAGTQFKQLCPIFDPDDTPMNQTPYLSDSNGLPPYVVFAFDSSFTKETLHQKLNAMPLAQPHAAYAAQGVKPQPPVDAVCVLGKYVLWNLRQVDGPLKIKANGQPARGWVAFDTAAPLSWTLGWLQLFMPRIVRNKPIFEWYMFRQGLTPTDPSSPAETAAVPTDQ